MVNTLLAMVATVFLPLSFMTGGAQGPPTQLLIRRSVWHEFSVWDGAVDLGLWLRILLDSQRRHGVDDVDLFLSVQAVPLTANIGGE